MVNGTILMALPIGLSYGVSDFYRDRSDNGTIRLHRISTGKQGGVFCCELPDASNKSQILCIRLTNTSTSRL